MDKDDKKSIVSILMELISIPGLSGSENKVAEYLKKKLKELNIHCYEEEGNIYAIKGSPEFLIATHMDTVPSWGYKEAFSPKFYDNKVWGRGAVDTKGQIAALLWALKNGRNFFVAFLRDEEEGGSGSRNLFIPDGLNIKGAVVLEPTQLRICISQAGALELEITAKGKASHGATVKRGENAIEKFIELFSCIKATVKKSDSFFPFSDINLGYIKGGLDVQIVPDTCTAKIDIPVFPGEDPDDILKKIEKLMGDKESFEYRVLEKSSPWMISKDELVVKRLTSAYMRALKSSPLFEGMPAWTDASNIMEKGIPCVVFGAGDLSCAHTPYEHIETEDLYKLFLVIEKFVE